MTAKRITTSACVCGLLAATRKLTPRFTRRRGIKRGWRPGITRWRRLIAREKIGRLPGSISTVRCVSTPTTCAREIWKCSFCANWARPARLIHCFNPLCNLTRSTGGRDISMAKELDCDLQTRLDLAHDFARAGFFDEAIGILKNAPARPGDLPDQSWGALPMIFYTLGWLHEKTGNGKAALNCFKRAAAESPDYCFPSRLEEIVVLETAMRANPNDARAPYYLGNLLYDRRRHEEAIPALGKIGETRSRFLDCLAQSRHRLFQRPPATGQSPRRLR